MGTLDLRSRIRRSIKTERVRHTRIRVDIVEYVYVLFTLIYLFEFVAKLSGLGWQKWKRNSWNIFDVVLLSGLCPVVIMRIFKIDVLINQEYAIFQAEKFFLDLVAFKLVQRIPVLHVLFKTVAYVTITEIF